MAIKYSYNQEQRLDILEYKIKELQGYKLELNKDLKNYQIGFLIGFGGKSDFDDEEHIILHNVELLNRGIYTWSKK